MAGYPYTALYVAGLRLGLTARDLRGMPLPRLLFMMDGLSAMGSGGGVSQATDEDIAELLM